MGQIDMGRWRPHLRAAKRAGLSLSRYAHKHGLSRHTLYAAQRAERDRQGLVPKSARAQKRSAPGKAAAFVPVALAATAPPLTVRLSNGVVLECRELEGARLAEFIASLAGLPCSA